MRLPGDKSAERVEPVRARRAIVAIYLVESERPIKDYEDYEDDVIDRWRRFMNEVRTGVLPTHFVLPPPGL